jgi:hypothetical protein
MNYKLERVWKEVVVVYSQCSISALNPRSLVTEAAMFSSDEAVRLSGHGGKEKSLSGRPGRWLTELLLSFQYVLHCMVVSSS